MTAPPDVTPVHGGGGAAVDGLVAENPARTLGSAPGARRLYAERVRRSSTEAPPTHEAEAPSEPAASASAASETR